jgi:hypothetical protein
MTERPLGGICADVVGAAARHAEEAVKARRVLPKPTPESRKRVVWTERNVLEVFCKSLRKWAAQGKTLQWPESCTWWTGDIRASAEWSRGVEAAGSDRVWNCCDGLGGSVKRRSGGAGLAGWGEVCGDRIIQHVAIDPCAALGGQARWIWIHVHNFRCSSARLATTPACSACVCARRRGALRHNPIRLLGNASHLASILIPPSPP